MERVMDAEKKAVHDFWEKASCGESQFLPATEREGYLQQLQVRYELEPYIVDFADFPSTRGKRVLEIGVGLGADHQKFAAAGAVLCGIDLTYRAVEHSKCRFRLFGLESNLQQGDAENLPFKEGYFDLVYSWGVLHHTPDMIEAIKEIHRVLKPGGELKLMIYHKYSFVGFMLWARYALLKLKPMTSLADIYSRYLESPGTKAFSVKEAEELFKNFRELKITTILSYGDLLEGAVGQRHTGLMLTAAKLIWPRSLISKLFGRYGLNLLIRAKK